MSATTARLPRTLAALGTPDFESTFKAELAGLGPAGLPLHRALTQGSHVLDEGIEVMVFRVAETSERMEAKVGIHFSSVLVGCACEDDPTPVSELAEYAEMLVAIDRRTGVAEITLLPD